MNIYALSGLINAVLTLALGLFVYAKNIKNNLNKRYAIFCFFVSFWSYSYFVWQISETPAAALFWCRLLMAGAIFIPIAFFHFIVSFLDIYQKKKNFLKFGYIIFLFFLILDFTSLFVEKVSPKLSFEFWPEPGVAFTPFILIWLFYCFYPCLLLFQAYKKSYGRKKNQTKYLLVGILVGYTSGSTNYFLWYDIPVPPFGNFIVPLFVSLMAYSIVKYHLMDIKLALTRAGLVFLVYSLVLGMPFWMGSRMLDQPGWWIPVLIMGVLATAGPFIYSYLRRRTENILLQEQNRYQRALKDFSSTLIFIRDIKELSDKVVTKIMHSVKLEFCAMYLKRDSNFFLQSKKAMDNPELPSIIETDSEFIISLKGKNSPVLGDYLPRLGSVKLGLVLPLFLNQELYGLILLGSKTKDTIFTNTDEDVFSIVSNQISLALSEIYYFNQFQKATEEKYKLGLEKARLESAFQISESYRHELGNVLNIISTSLANLMFIGDYVPSKEDIEQTRISISNNIKRAQKVFSAISKYNENSKSEFKEVKLNKVLEEVVDEQKETISKSGIKLQIGMKDNITISANNNFSFALKYLLEGAIGAIEYTKPEDKLINIELTNVDTIAHLEISDTGQDVTTDKMYKGVGIERAKEGGILYFIARRIIFDHQGKFQMSSFNSGKGTSFIIELPLAKGGG